MQLRTRLTLLFLFLALVPLGLVSYLGYLNQREALLNRTAEQLDSLADVQEERVNAILDRYLDQIRLVSSRTQLRATLATYIEDPSAEDLESLTEIISDADNSSTLIVDISIISADGEVLVSTLPSYVGESRSGYRSFEKGKIEEGLYDIFATDDNVLYARLAGPLYQGDEFLGVVEIIASSLPIFSVTEDYTGLGGSGESLLVEKNDNGDAVFLTPLRFDSGAALRLAIPKEKTNIPATVALAEREEILATANTVDYRGEPVIAVTRYIDALEWGLIVKVDQAEVFESVREAARSSASILLLSIGIITLLSYFTTQAVVSPIKKLTLFAQNLQAGNFKLRAEIESSDEIGFLAQTLNSMAQKLQQSYSELEQKVRERTARLEEAQRIAHLGNFVHDLKTNEVYWSDESFQVHGWEPSDTHAPPPLDVYFGVMHPDDVEAAKASIDHAMTTTGESEHIYRVIWPDDSVHFVQVTSKLSLNSEGKPFELRGTFQDVTKERQIDEAKTEFVSLASHQLRTPLTAINWYTELLLTDDALKLSKDHRQYLEEIAQGSRRMTDLVSSLLNVSRIELGTFAVDTEKTQILSIFTSTLNELELLIKEKRLSIKEDNDELPEISVDAKLLRMVYQNIITNAIKYTPEKGSISIEHRLQKDHVLISIADTGYGIPQNQQSQIFTKLFRADNVLEKDTRGTGLGLYIVKSIMTESGGDVWFESPYTVDGKEVQGTKFYIKLPLAGMKQKEGSKPLE